MKIGLLPCQGTSNTGMMSTKAAVHFVDQKQASMVCPLGLPLGIKGIVESALKNDEHIALNGCPIKCASKALDSIGLKEYDEMTFTTDFEIQKNGNFHDEIGLPEIITELDKRIHALLGS